MELIHDFVIRQAQLIQMTGLSRSTLWDLQNPKSPRFDASFPTRIRLSVRAVGWKISQVEAWLSSRHIGHIQTKGGAK